MALIIVKNPTMVLQPLDENGDPSGAPVDVSCDVQSAELDASVPTSSVTTFCGTFQTAGDPEIGFTVTVVVQDDTNTRWASLVGDSVEVQLKDRTTDTTYRSFTSLVPLNPALYGPTEPGEPRSFDFDMPVLSEVTIVTPS